METNVNLFDLNREEREACENIYGSTPPAYVDIKRNRHGEIIGVTREGRLK